MDSTNSKQPQNDKAKDNWIDKAALATSIVAIVITLLVFNYENNKSERIEIEQMRPYLSIEFNKADSEKMKGFLLRNVGNGAAEIQSFRYFRNRNELKDTLTSWFPPNEKFLLGNSFYFEKINWFPPGHIILANERSDTYILGTSQDTSSKEGEKDVTFYYSKEKELMDEIIIEIEYRSLSQFDHSKYVLRYCENFKRNNMRELKVLTEEDFEEQ